LVVTPDQYAQYYAGQPIRPIQVLLPALTPKSTTLFDKAHDLIAKLLCGWRKSKPTNPDYLNAAQFDQSDHVSETTLLCIRAFFAYYLLCNMLTTFWLNTDGIMHMWYFFTYWALAATLFAMVYA
jgi:hypothetical protein